jgi:hypothetical protein
MNLGFTFILISNDDLLINWCEKWINVWKLSSIQMKISNGIACKPNWFLFWFNLIQIPILKRYLKNENKYVFLESEEQC